MPGRARRIAIAAEPELLASLAGRIRDLDRQYYG